MFIEDLWYKNAIIYCLDVEKYIDANGDGVGDFEGLSRRLDYLAGLGVTCVWLQPFYPSPNRDNGYDVSDYYGVASEARHARRLRRVHEPRPRAGPARHRRPGRQPHVDRASRGSRRRAAIANSPFRDWYVWADERPEDHDKGMVFPGVQKTTWTWDRRPQTVLLPSLLRASGRPQHAQPGRARRDPARSWASGWSSASRASAWTRCRS